MAGRIEVYIHSDKSTENKGACLIEVTTQTDFAAKTELFKNFCHRVAMYCYGSTADWDTDKLEWNGLWEHIAELFPFLDEEKKSLEKELKEKVEIRRITKLTLGASLPHPSDSLNLEMGEEDWKRFLEMLENPPEPTPALLRAAERYKKMVRSGCIEGMIDGQPAWMNGHKQGCFIFTDQKFCNCGKDKK